MVATIELMKVFQPTNTEHGSMEELGGVLDKMLNIIE